jgi:O-antigen/teichoic acid export membrane protein
MAEDGKTFSRDVLWNVASLGIAGVLGVAINSIVGKVYGAAALGIFNQVFAIYIVVSQLAVLGVHSSTLFYLAASHEPDEQRTIIGAALRVTLVQALVIGGGFAAVALPFAHLLDSPEVATGIWWAAPGLVCFALNKVVLAALNALRRMRAYAVFQACRIVVMAAALGVLCVLRVDRATLAVILSIGEAVTLAGALWTLRDRLGRTVAADRRRWARTHLRYGARGFLAGLFGELNTRIDVIILGAFVSDAIVGAYSFAAILAEGAYQILIALRTNYAPIMVRLLARGEADELTRTIHKARGRIYLGALGLGALSAAGYALVIPHLTSDPDLQGSGIYFAIVLAGMVAASGYTPFNQLLLWGGKPGWHTVMIAIVVGSSAVLCCVLVALWGAVGAAAAVALTYAGSIVLLRGMVARVLHLRT